MDQEEELGEALPDTPVSANEGGDAQPETEKKPKKKGNWKTIGHEPVNYELYPCVHRWQKSHPRGPCVQYKQVRWILLPLSDRLAQLALPLLRRLLALWLEFGDKFPPEMRARFMKFLCENYGLSDEFLEQILAEAIKARNPPEKEEKVKKTKRKKPKRKKVKAKKKEEIKESKPKEKGKGLNYKRRKAGKLPLDWPYKTGSKFLLKCIAYLSTDPDEDYNSRATEYFDVQAMAILEQICQFMDMSLPDPNKPTQYGETLVIMALNLADWIAKFVTTPAQAIPDNKVDEFLSLRGEKPKVKPKAHAKEKGKEKPPKVETENEIKDEVKNKREPTTEVQRNWNELKSPVYVPEKSRISKRKHLEEGEGEEEERDTHGDVGYASDMETGGTEEGNPNWAEPTLDDIKKEFLEYINWYNPWEPEFMYFGPRKTPTGVDMYKIWDSDTDEVPSDLRVLNWNQVEYGYSESYSFIPSPVPQYYPALRPLRPISLEDLEKSGISRDVIKRNLRFFSPWYLMREPLKPRSPASPVQTSEEMSEETQGEFDEETLEDEILVASAAPPVKDSVWGSEAMQEQLQIIGHIIRLMASVPDLTLEHVFELLEEFCEAVGCAELDENSSEENKLLLKKRTIILERYYFEFFGKKFRDYNDRTPHFMRLICSRCAYFIQILYEYTARVLWEFQSQANPPSPVTSRPPTPDDPEALRDWDEWLAWLLRVTKTCDEWAGWVTDTVNEAERKAAKKKNEFVRPDGQKMLLTSKEWYGWKTEVEQKVFEYASTRRKIFQESPYYAEKAKNIIPVKHRAKVCENDLLEEEEEEKEEEGEGEFEEGGWEKEHEELVEDIADETEWEDVGEGGM